MTDNEIIKALEVCVGIHNDCDNCPLLEYSQATDECMTEAMSNALDLINRQKAEIENCYEFIEQLKKARNIWDDKCTHQNAEIERLQKLLDDKCDRCIAKDRAEAVKEFAERLKDRPRKHLLLRPDSYYKQYVRVTDIDNLVKEMVGEG